MQQIRSHSAYFITNERVCWISEEVVDNSLLLTKNCFVYCRQTILWDIKEINRIFPTSQNHNAQSFHECLCTNTTSLLLFSNNKLPLIGSKWISNKFITRQKKISTNGDFIIPYQHHWCQHCALVMYPKERILLMQQDCVEGAIYSEKKKM